MTLLYSRLGARSNKQASTLHFSTSGMNKTSDQDGIRTYKSSVAARSQRNSCLQNLLLFLQSDTLSQYACRIVCLEFCTSSKSPIRRSLDLNNLALLLRNTKRERGDMCGRLLIIEDLSNDIVETLGSLLDIDPLFFASHIDIFQDEIATTRPSTATLPSTMRSQGFLNLPYHRVIQFENIESEQGLLRDMNVPRKVAILPRLKGINVGLARHCCSILKTDSKDGLWLGKRCLINYGGLVAKAYIEIGLMLVDPPISNSYVSRRNNGKATFLKFQTRLFQGGFQDFRTGPSFSDNINSESCPTRSSPLESFIFYWNIQKPPGFDVDVPTLFSLSSYPLRMITAEWMTYLELMYHSIKQYEYSPETTLAALGQIAILSADMHTLQQWARRSIATRNKIRLVIEYLRNRMTKEDDIEYSAVLIEDYEHIAVGIDTYSRRLEALVMIATSLIQAIDCRRSLTETLNISRLTYLALSFIPLTFVSGLFSMNDNIAPVGKLFGLYFAISIPLCVLVFLFVYLTTSTPAFSTARTWRSRAIQKFGV